MKRNNIIAVVVIIVILVVILTAAVIKIHNMTTLNGATWVEYTIMPGDTMWSIVEHNVEYNNYDIRVIIDAIKTHNNIDENLIPYTVIEIPVWEEG